MAPLVIYGPQGCGKTTKAQALAEHFGCSTIVDDWDGRAPLPDDTLALYNGRGVPPWCAYEHLSFDTAMVGVRVAQARRSA